VTNKKEKCFLRKEIISQAEVFVIYGCICHYV